MVNQLEAVLRGNGGLQLLDFLGPKLHHLSGLQIDDVIMVRHIRSFEARASAFEGVAVDNAGVFEDCKRAVYCRKRDRLIHGARAPVQFVGIRVVFRC